MKYGLMSRLIRLYRREEGQSLILFTVTVVLLIGVAALTLDMGMFMAERRKLRNATDAAALAGVLQLPNGATAAQSAANQYIGYNVADVNLPDISVSYRCVVHEDSGTGSPDPNDIPAACDPGVSATWTCNGATCVSPCDPTTGAKCNTVVVEASKDVPFYFAPIFGMASESTGQLQAAACRGTCGASTIAPVDVVMVLDRTGSLGADGLARVKAGAKQLLETLDPTFQHVALGAIPSSDTADSCIPTPDGTIGDWVPVPLSSDYQNSDGTLNTSSALVQTIDCLVQHNTGYPGTNLGDPVTAAKQHLQSNGRAGADQVVILLTDGKANMPEGVEPCEYAFQQADLAKQAGIEVYTIGVGIDGTRCTADSSSSSYRNVLVSTLLADMATDSADDQGNCATSGARIAENNDGDHFQCEESGVPLNSIFRQAAEDIIINTGARLIRLP